MDGKLQQQLFERYPLIFQERHLPMTDTAMCWGVMVGNGWFHVLDALCAALQRTTDQDGEPQVVASQVKEKFGTLRFYTRASTDVQDAMIDVAEEVSARTCDVCGCPGQLVRDGWLRTRCEKECCKDPSDA